MIGWIWNLALWLVAGVIGGYLAGWFLKGDKELNRYDVVFGVIGALVAGGFLSVALGIGSGRGLIGVLWNVIVAFVGAVVVVWVYEKITRREAP